MQVSTAIVIPYTVILGIFSICCIILFITGYIIGPYWNPNASKSHQRVLFLCALTYAIGAFLVFIGLTIFLIDNWSSAEIIYFIFIIIYAISWFSMLYVWIQRLETTFQNSAYEYSPKFMRRLKILYWFIIADGIYIHI